MSIHRFSFLLHRQLVCRHMLSVRKNKYQLSIVDFFLLWLVLFLPVLSSTFLDQRLDWKTFKDVVFYWPWSVFFLLLLVETLWFIARAMTTITRRKPVPSTATSGTGAYSDSASNSISQSNPHERDERDRDDERDNDDDKETRLTLMEEVLLLGLKDREVSFVFSTPWHFEWPIFSFRVIHHSGTTVFRRVYVDVSSLNWVSVDESNWRRRVLDEKH